MKSFAGFLMISLTTAAVPGQEPPRPNPAKPVDYVAWLNERFTPKGPNAATEYIAAAKLYVDDEEALEILSDGFQWGPEQEKHMRGWVRLNRKCLTRFAVATRIEACYFVRDVPASQGMAWTLPPDLKPLRGMARACVARARLRLVAGNLGAAFRDLDSMLRCMRHMRAQPDAIEFLVGTSVGDYAYRLLLELPRLSESVDYDAALQRLEKIDSAELLQARFFVGELLFVWDAGQRFLRDDDSDGKYERILIPEEVDAAHRPPTTIADFVKRTQGIMSQWRNIYAGEYSDARRKGELLDTIIKSTQTIESIFLADFWPACKIDRRLRAHRNAVRIVFALHAYHDLHGRWPETLAAGAPGKLAQYRIDPFSGRDFVYRLKDGQPLLYSVGENGRDDGGRKDPKKQWAADGDAILMEPDSNK